MFSQKWIDKHLVNNLNGNKGQSCKINNDTTEQILLYLCIIEMLNSKIYK